MKQTIIFRQFVLLAMLLVLTAGAGAAHQPGELQQTIGHLLEYVNQSGLTFVRNGKAYTAPEAARHMRRKYEHFQDDIGSAEDFIRLCATRSLVTGKPYMLVGKDGRELATGDWLVRELLEYRRKSAAAGP
jgi:hypothetical protein